MVWGLIGRGINDWERGGREREMSGEIRRMVGWKEK